MTKGEDEVWKPITAYDGYEVSNFGRVRSLDRFIRNRWDGENMVKGQIIKPKVGKDNTTRVGLTLNGKQRFYQLSHIVALEFLENPNDLDYVIHFNGDMTDNRVCNLAWASKQEAFENAQLFNKLSGKIKKLNNHRSRPIIQIAPDGTEKEYPSISEAQRICNLDDSGMWKAANGEFTQSNGYKYKFKAKQV